MAETDECSECRLRKRLQPKLAIGSTSDPLEQQADRVSQEVLQRPEAAVTSAAPVSVQRSVQTGAETAGPAPASVGRALEGTGVPLDPALRRTMEQRFGHDFSSVRVHRGASAERSARDVNASAYTVGEDLVFAAGQFAPHTPGGMRLIAHELTHVLQQRLAPAPIIRRSLAGCADLVKQEQGLGLLSGTKVHSLIAAHFKAKVKGARNVQIPGASAGPLRTDDICGKPSSVLKPETGGGAAAVAGAGLPDLARITSRQNLQVAEIKPAALVCLVDGENQLARYIDHGNASDPAQVRWRAAMGVNIVTPLSSSDYTAPTLTVPTPAGTLSIETAWCTPGLLAYSVSLKRKRSRRRVRQPKPEPVRVPQTSRVRVRGFHPYFQDVENSLPYLEAAPGRDFVLVIDAGLYGQHVAEADRLRLEAMKRSMRVDPRGIPLFQVQPVLIGGAFVAGFVGAVILAFALAPLIIAAAPAVVSAVSAAATSVATKLAAGAAIRWAAVRLTPAAAAGVATLLVSRGIADAETAKEAVKPLIDKPLAAMADVTGSPDWADPKPGQEIILDGQSFRAIGSLTTQ